ncbi:MAG: HEPN domain-containing protein, partial [Proteobacteria bacterium]|nr:HEPN domain-containing protein [Pseudomonadota bacterium]
LAALLLVFTGYKPKTHDLKELVQSASNQDPSLIMVFPKTDKLEKKRFSLLRRAYIDARYDMENFKVTREDLQWLGERVRKLRDITADTCRKKISSFS